MELCTFTESGCLFKEMHTLLSQRKLMKQSLFIGTLSFGKLSILESTLHAFVCL